MQVYFITDRSLRAGRNLEAIVGEAVQAGVDLVQLREKDLSGRELFVLTGRLVPICRRAGARLLVNDRLDVALAAGADGVHLPAGGLPVAAVRQAVPDGFLIGVSTHAAEEVERAESDGADFVVFGPVFPTPAKLRYGPPLGLEPLREVVERVKIPVYAIGGIDPAAVEQIRGLPVAGVAVIRAIMESPDIAATVRRLRRSG